MADFAKELLQALDRNSEMLEKIGHKLDALSGYVEKAESEVPEYIRRFTMFYHDIVHINWRYEEMGLQVPPWIRAEMERSHDRLKHVLEAENNQGGAFHKIRQEMDKMEGNKYTHFRRKE